MIVDWIVRAWMYLKQQEDMIRKAFLVTGIANAMGGSEDHLCHQDSLLTAVHSEIQEYTRLAEEIDEIQLDLFSNDSDTED